MPQSGDGPISTAILPPPTGTAPWVWSPPGIDTEPPAPQLVSRVPPGRKADSDVAERAITRPAPSVERAAGDEGPVDTVPSGPNQRRWPLAVATIHSPAPAREASAGPNALRDSGAPPFTDGSSVPSGRNTYRSWLTNPILTATRPVASMAVSNVQE